MNAPAPSSLAPDVLARRLAELVAEERGALVEFLLHLEEFDRRRAWAEAGYDSLWTYCQRVLHLREGPAGRRIAAMRAVRQYPRLADALRDGRLCLSTVTLLAPLLREEALDDVVARAAYRTKAEVEHLVASLLPREAPRDGIRRLPERRANGEAAPRTFAIEEQARPTYAAAGPTLDADAPSPPRSGGEGWGEGAAVASTGDVGSDVTISAAPSPSQAAAAGAASRTDHRPVARPTLTPVAAEIFSLRVTLDTALKADLDELTALLSHKVPDGDLAAVLREAVHCALEKHGRRKGARAPARERAPARKRAHAPTYTNASHGAARDASVRPHIPAHVRREVWKRDGGRCTWRGPDGHRCESRWRLELDHVVPFALGGAPAADGLRLLCRVHNELHAEQVFGAERMARFRRDGPDRVRSLIPG
jgi:5-methylcytosine-specific restriction endonuclease McrA